MSAHNVQNKESFLEDDAYSKVLIIDDLIRRMHARNINGMVDDAEQVPSCSSLFPSAVARWGSVRFERAYILSTEGWKNGMCSLGISA